MYQVLQDLCIAILFQKSCQEGSIVRNIAISLTERRFREQPGIKATRIHPGLTSKSKNLFATIEYLWCFSFYFIILLIMSCKVVISTLVLLVAEVSDWLLLPANRVAIAMFLVIRICLSVHKREVSTIQGPSLYLPPHPPTCSNLFTI